MKRFLAMLFLMAATGSACAVAGASTDAVAMNQPFQIGDRSYTLSSIARKAAPAPWRSM
jgi:hypothetical protein